jgi:hypothetical protein
MQSRVKVALAVGVLVISTGVGFAVGQAQMPQPHMYAALSDLQAAQHELQVAMRNKGGHRLAALQLVNEAIGETQAGIDAGDGY